jgi:5-methylcytosine-specific restriction endonuclease McrA
MPPGRGRSTRGHARTDSHPVDQDSADRVVILFVDDRKCPVAQQRPGLSLRMGSQTMCDATPVVATRGPNKGVPVDSPTFTCPRCMRLQARDQFIFRTDGRPRYCLNCGRSKYAANAEEMREKSRRWGQENPDRVRERSRAHYIANREKAAIYAREYAKKWRKDHPEYGAESSRRRRERLAAVDHIPVTDAQREARWGYYGGRCWMCGGAATAWDHVKPVMHGGPDILANLRPTCKPCNSSKGRSWPVHTHVLWMPISDLRFRTVRSASSPTRG